MSEQPETVTNARESIRRLTRDPVTRLLLDHSQLTFPQLESLLADSLSFEQQLKKEIRRLFRPSGRNVSRGAFNRTLIQAQNNVIRSIYTVLLMGYLGLFDTPSLQPFMELSDTIQSYVQEIQQTERELRSGRGASLDELKAKLFESVSALAKRQSFKDLL